MEFQSINHSINLTLNDITYTRHKCVFYSYPNKASFELTITSMYNSRFIWSLICQHTTLSARKTVMDHFNFNAFILLHKYFCWLEIYSSGRTMFLLVCCGLHVLMREGMQNQVCLIFSMHVQYANKLSVAMNKSHFWRTINTEEGSKVLV